jgi:exonuclease III
MRGRFNNGKDKWSQIRQIIKSQKIGILALQETHLSPDDEKVLNTIFEKDWQIISSIDPNNPNARGVAIVLNKRLTSNIGVVKKEIIPGRALQIIMPWRKELKLSVLAIYAPNDGSNNESFWAEIREKIDSQNKPDVMLGDFNLVEDALDRLPAHRDHQGASEELAKLKSHLNLTDGWRHENPDGKNYTYTQSEQQGGAKSRIDRIYVTSSRLRYCKRWELNAAGIPTDHKLVSVCISDKKLPFIGKGRWVIPLFLLKNQKLNDTIQKLGKDLENKMERLKHSRTETDNPQTLFNDFKNKLIAEYRTAAKESKPKIINKIQTLTNKLQHLYNNPELTDEEKQLSGCVLQEEINTLQQSIYEKLGDNKDAKIRLESESAASKSWAQSGKTRPPRDTIIELHIPNTDPPQYTDKSVKMAEVARDYHNNLQNKGLADENTKNQTTQEILNILNSKLSSADKNELAKYLTRHEIAEAIHLLPNGKSPGIDGIPNELWKALQKTYKMSNEKSADKKPLDIAQVLQNVYNDIEQYGIIPGSKFASGWMCPIYKKKDKRDIANYRPITLLNTDYKIFTKTLAIKLSKTAPTVIHENQAGFIPGRSITAQIRLTQMIMNYAEAEEIGGVIVSLDQEKAYDKITHDYLWKVLEKMNFPQHFIQTVRTIYESAETAIMINGEMSSTFKITRGVRQGCPLSCLLFDLAIEPLAEMLRQSDLKGFTAPELAYRIVTTLFADDTVVYLTSEDEMQTLDNILDKWCIASGACFNKGKTQLIPIGPKHIREQIISTRKLSENQTDIPSDIHIVEEGEATRILGAWIGNETNEEAIWTPILESIDSNLNYWNKMHPTIEGRKIITQWIVGGKTQYLTVAQGMPKEIERQLTKKIKEFTWDNNGKPTIGQDILCAPIEHGGKAMLNLEARNEAIELNWLKELIKQSDPWTYFANALLAKHAKLNPKIDSTAQHNYFLQSWEFKQKNLPLALQRIMKIKKKFNTQIEALAFPQEVKNNMPIWFHIAASTNLNQLNNHYYSPCLRKTHEIQTVGQINTFISTTTPEHRQKKECLCISCTADKGKGCKNPAKCRKLAKKIMECIPPKWHPNNNLINRINPLTDREKEQNKAAAKNNTEVIFDPDINLKGTITNAIRVFTTNTSTNDNTLLGRPKTANNGPNNILVITAGKTKINEEGNYISSGAACFQNNTYANILIKVPEQLSTPASGELCAILEALKKVPDNKQLHLQIQSKNTFNSLTKDLKRNELLGWLHNPDARIIKAIIAELRQRNAQTGLKLQKPGTNIMNIKKADKFAEQALQKTTIDKVDTSIERSADLQGIQLDQGSQAIFYQGILKNKALTQQHQQTKINLSITKHATYQSNGKTPTDSQIWKSIRDRDIPKSIRGFLWKSIHNAYKIGSFWAKIPEYEQRANCCLCNEIENMDHILIDCPKSLPIKIIWNLAKRLWEMKGEKWESINYGKIIGCNLRNLKTRKKKPDQGKNRLYTIIISESASLIWRLRCQKVIEYGNGKDHTETEIHNKWTYIINTRLKLDKILTNKYRYGNKAISKKKVLETWSGVLYDEDGLSEDWTKQPGVLVGITSLRPPGRNR